LGHGPELVRVGPAQDKVLAKTGRVLVGGQVKIKQDQSII